MADRSAIEWCDSTFNPWIGCTRVSPACDHCYAAVSTPARALSVAWGAGETRRRTSEGNWKIPLLWNAKAFVECTRCGLRSESPAPVGAVVAGLGPVYCGSCGPEHRAVLRNTRRRVFCASLADVFDNEVDPQWRRDLLRLIATTQDLDWLLLTKRIGNAESMLSEAAATFGMTWGAHWENVWLGATICNQQEADRDIPKLLATPAAVRFLSIEPMLGPIDLHLVNLATEDDGPLDDISDEPLTAAGLGIGWVIAGGESGKDARPMHPGWVRSLRIQCAAAGTPFLFKQWGEWLPEDQPESGRFCPREDGRDLHLWPDEFASLHVGKKAAGRLLDGALHNGFPESPR